NREFVAHTGTYRGHRITALSTGIGTDNIDIVLNELDALANIDFTTRALRAEHRALRLVRLGTCGSIQPDVPAGALVLSTHAFGFDGLLHYYQHERDAAMLAAEDAFLTQTNWNPAHTRPYLVQADQGLLELLREGTIGGVTATAPGFYAPQGRVLRLALDHATMNDRIAQFAHNGLRIVNYEMETSALYGLGGLLGHHCATVCTVIANRSTGDFYARYKERVDEMIGLVLDRLTA
ncbi:MAG: nucleoside phosphorylase, partial [Bacteroidota bacterium]